jgi:hypothetical protein
VNKKRKTASPQPTTPHGNIRKSGTKCVPMYSETVCGSHMAFCPATSWLGSSPGSGVQITSQRTPPHTPCEKAPYPNPPTQTFTTGRKQNQHAMRGKVLDKENPVKRTINKAAVPLYLCYLSAVSLFILLNLISL